MKCPECVEAGKRSHVHVGATFSTAMFSSPFYDEDGVYHLHDPNGHTTSYSCSEGHKWAESRLRNCPAPGCDWAEQVTKQQEESRVRFANMIEGGKENGV